MKINVENLGTIKKGNISLKLNNLNVKYGLNGTGKSTLSKGIVAMIKGNSLNEYRNYYSNSDPIVDINDNDNTGKQFKSVVIFNDDYVSQYLYKESDIARNTYEIFINTKEYQNRLKEMNDILNDLVLSFKSEDINSLLIQLQDIVHDFKFNKQKKGEKVPQISGTSVIAKGRKAENVLEKLDKQIVDYTDYFKSSNSNGWLKWFNEGENYLIKDECPYCLNSLDRKKFSIKQRLIKNACDNSALKNNNQMKDHYSKIIDILNNEQKQSFDKVVNSSNTLEEKDQKIVYNVINLFSKEVEKIKSLQSVNATMVRRKYEEGDLTEFLQSNKLMIELFSNSENEKIAKIKDAAIKLNNSIDKTLQQQKELDKIVQKFSNNIAKTVEGKAQDINEFLKVAGIPYKISIQSVSDELYKTSLIPVNCTEKNCPSKVSLSYGEKNCISLILFAYDAIANENDLIILDDPISSFDNNKKFAMLYYLFAKENALFDNKTVLMFTHDFEIIEDLMFKNKLNGKDIKNNYLANISCAYVYITQEFILSEINILKNNIKSTIKKWRMYARDNNKSLLCRLTNLRKYCEYIKRTEPESKCGTKRDTYEIISDLEHLRDTSRITGEKMDKAIIFIKEFIKDFDYDKSLKQYKDIKKLKRWYKNAKSANEKLQIIRIFIDVLSLSQNVETDNVFFDFVTQTFHIENNELFSLDEEKYERVPKYIISACDEFIDSH